MVIIPVTTKSHIRIKEKIKCERLNLRIQPYIYFIGVYNVL